MNMQQKSRREVISIKLSDIEYLRPNSLDSTPNAAELLDVQYDAAKQMVFITLANGENAAYQAEGGKPQAIPGKLKLEYLVAT
jgi:hypothetical protein